MTPAPEWITGFVGGEGCFHVGVNHNSGMRCGDQVLPEFTVVQHERDVKALLALRDFFECGVVRTNHAERKAYRVRGLDHLVQRIIPFFERHPLQTSKRQDFEMFRSVVLMMKVGLHLRVDGIGAIRAIASRMNRGRSR